MATDTPSKTLLLTRRAEKDLVGEGKAVLEDRRDLLAHMLVQEMRRTEELLTSIDAELVEARDAFRRCVLRHGIVGLSRFTGQPALASVSWRVENRLGARYLSGDCETPAADASELTDSWVISLELEAALPVMRKLLLSLLQLAIADNNLQRLIAIFRRTQRRVNALEHIVLPELTATIKEMEDRMDEMERDDLVRSLLIKRRMQQP